MSAPNLLALLCKDTKKELTFSGTNVMGFDFGFCNVTETVQTDVGVCIGSNSNQYVLDGKILQQDTSRPIDGGLKDVEHVMILLVDRFGDTDKEVKNSKVRKTGMDHLLNIMKHKDLSDHATQDKPS